MLVVAMATSLFGPISGQEWTYQQIGEGWQSDTAMSEKEERDALDFRFISYSGELMFLSLVLFASDL